MVFLSDTDIRIPTNKIFTIQGEFFGTGDLHVYSPRGGGILSLRAAASPDYTGTIYIEQSVGNVPLAQTSLHMCTNASFVVRTGAALKVAQIARMGKVVRMEPGSALQAEWASPSSNIADFVILGGVVTNATQRNSFINFRGDVSGIGTLVKMNNNPDGTNMFTGSISPGLNGAGKLTINEQQGVTLIGMPGTPVTLNIEDGDQLALLNMDVALDLANVSVKFLTETALGTTNWFLTCDSGFVGSFNAVEYAPMLNGIIIQENNQIGAVVVPEPALMLMGALALLTARRRR